MLVLELYFLLYRIPRLMSGLARERNRSALAWSLFGIGAWIGAEVGVMLVASITHGLGIALLNWPAEMNPGVTPGSLHQWFRWRDASASRHLIVPAPRFQKVPYC